MSDAPAALRVISFRLGKPTILLNTALRQHHQQLARIQRDLAWEIKLKILGRIPAVPFPRARVTITRYSVGTPDQDGLVGGMKQLIDCLVDPQIRMVKGQPKPLHPNGLGIIADDSPDCVELVPIAVRVRHLCEQATDVSIEELAA